MPAPKKRQATEIAASAAEKPSISRTFGPGLWARFDALLTVGTSAVVYPAAEIPRIAARSGATVIQVNPEPTPLDVVCTVNLRGTAAGVLPHLVAEVSAAAGR